MAIKGEKSVASRKLFWEKTFFGTRILVEAERKEVEKSMHLKIRKMVILFFFISFLSACSTTRMYWGDWRNWTGWEATGKMESQVVSINSTPEGAKVYVDGTLKGDTPISLSLSYPMLRSERLRYKYEQVKPGLLESFLGTRPSTSTIDSQNEERSKAASRTYIIEVRKESFSLAKKTISVPDTGEVNFLLKNKPNLLIKKFLLKNNIKLSFFEKLYELLYENRFSVDIAKFEGIEKQFFKSTKVKEVFETTTNRKGVDYELEGDVVIGREFIEIKTTITDKSGSLITQQSACLETKKVGSMLQPRVEHLISSILDSFLGKLY